MIFTENFRVALRALTANKLRSALTMLGIIIGVGAVVALMAIGQGATSSITSQIESAGSNLVMVIPMRQSERMGQPNVTSLYYSDYQALQSFKTNIAAIAPVFQTSQNVKYGGQSILTSVMGVTPDYAVVNAWKVARGRFITEGDRKSEARVAVLGSQTANDLFGGVEPVGRKINVGGVPFEVVGVLQSKGSSGFGSQDDMVLVPLETGYRRLFGSSAAEGGKNLLSMIFLSATSPKTVNTLMAQVERILRNQHGIKPGEATDLTIMSQNDILSIATSITKTLTTFLGAIAAISLLVGGIGIMNISLVSVTERTREIGLRKAVGAKFIHILLQFLIESVTMSVLGGLLGIALGAGIGAIVTATGVITSKLTLDSVMLAFSFSAAVGLFFGIYPAMRAARLRPIDALRYE
jgi:putative ABC transport system permease protein